MRKIWKKGVALLLALAILPYDCLDMGMRETVYAAEEPAEENVGTAEEDENLTADAEQENLAAVAEENFSATLQNNADVMLTWESMEGGVNYNLYRDDILLYHTQTGEERRFYCDIQTEAGKTYHYSLVVENESGEVIYTSEALEIVIPEALTIDSNFTLTKDMTVYSVTVTKGTVNLNGHTLKVCKDYSQSYGSLLFSKGYLYCYENFRISDYAGVSMTNVNDYLYVGKNIFWNNRYGSSGLTGGTIEVAGNFTSVYEGRFLSSGEHKVIFCGTEEQVISLKDKNYFNIIEITNRSEAGVRSATDFQYESLIRNGYDLTIGDCEPRYGFTLTEDTELFGDFYMTADTMDLNGYTLTINGDLIQAGGIMQINGGRLIVNGDYRLETRKLQGDAYIYDAGKASLRMQNEEDYIRVVGSFIDSSTVDHSGKLTNGILEVMGDIAINGEKSFMPDANHTLLLSGNGRQTVTLPSASGTAPDKTSHLSNVEISNESKDGVDFSGEPYVAGCMTDNRNVIGGCILVDSGTTFAEGYFGGNIKTLPDTEWKEDLTIGGDLVAYGNLTIASHVIVMEDLIGQKQYSGESIGLEHGCVEVYGDMVLDESQKVIYMTHEDDELYVHGNLTYVPYRYSESILTDGMIRVEGNLSLGDGFRAAGTHKVVLCGDDLQVLTISDNAFLAVVELQNYSEQGVYSETVFHAERMETNDCVIVYGESVPPGEEEEEKNMILQEDTQWDGDYLLSEGNLDLNGYTLTIHGDLIQAAGMVDIHGGSLIVEGNYRIQTKQGDGDSYGKSSGILKMTDESDYVQVKGSFFTDSDQSHEGFLTAGTLEIWGNVTVNDSHIRSSFCATNDHKLLLAGTQEQSVSMGDSYTFSNTCSQICNVESVNESEAGVVFEGETYVAHCLNDNGNVMKGDICIGPDTVFQTGYFGGNVTIYGDTVIDQDITIGGNLNSGNNLQIASHVVVKGDFKHQVVYYDGCGYLEMMHGRLEVYGDMTVGSGWYNYGFHMEHSDDEIYVHGNCRINTSNEMMLSDGKLWVEGDFNVYEPFQAIGNHTIIFCGDSKQTVSLCDNTSLANVELQNHSMDGIYIATSFVRNKLIRNGCRITYGNMEGEYGWTLEEDMVWDGDLVLLEDTLDLNGYTLTVQGNLLQQGGTVYIHGGRLEVQGDYLIQRQDENSYFENSYCSGILEMTNAADYVFVQGDFLMASLGDSEGKLIHGTLEVKGDFLAYSEYFYSDVQTYSGFHATGDHKVLLSGNEKQRVEAYPENYHTCQFSCLEITNCSEEGVEFIHAPHVMNSVNDHGNRIKGDIRIGTDTRFTDNHFGGGIIVEGEYTIADELDIDGDVTLKESMQIDGTLRVAGDFKASYNGEILGAGTIVFRGTGLQQIDIGRDLSLPHVVLENFSAEGVHTDTIIKYLSLKRNGCRFSIGTDEPGYGMTLDSDYICEEDLVLTEGTLDLNGHTLTVNGDFIQQGGSVFVHGGTLIVQGDYHIQVRNETEWSTSYSSSCGIIVMEHEADSIRVSGDLIIDTIRDMKQTLTAGILYVSGDVIQEGDTAFGTGAGFTMELCGESQQTLRGNYDMTVGSLVNNSAGGCRINSDIIVLRHIEDKTENVSGTGRVCITNTIQSEEIRWSGKLAITGHVTQPADIYVGDTLFIEGTLLCGAQKIETNHLLVTDALHIQRAQVICDGDLTVEESGRFIMQDPEGYVLVNGQMNFITDQSHAGLLTDGTLELRGDFSQQQYANFIATDHHTTILSSKKSATGKGYKQEIVFGQEAGTARFHRLIIRKKVEDCYFTPAVEKVADEVIYENTDTGAPMQVSYLKHTGVSANTITLSYGGTWDEAGIGGYEIYRDGARIAVTSQNIYTDSGLAPETEYSYQVYPYDRVGNIAQTSPVLKVTTLADMQAPEIPEGLAVASCSGSAITVSWHGAADNIGVEGYRIYRDGEMVAEVTEGTSYKDSGLEENTDYTYQVSSYDAAGNESERSTALRAATVMPQIVSISPEDQERILTNSVNITVTYQNKGNCQNSTVNLEYQTGNVWKSITPCLLTGQKYGSSYRVQYTWNIEELERDRDYPIRVTLYDEDGNTDVQQITCRVVREEIQPPNYVTAKADAGTVRLTWESSSNVECSGYRIYRAVGSGSTYSLIREIGDVEAYEYVDTNVSAQTVYHYQISSISLIQGESPRSDAVEVTANADTKAPVVSSMTPQSGRVHESVRLSATASDNKALASIRFAYHPLDDNTWIPIEAVEAANGWAACSWNTTSLADGTYMVRAIAVDTSGNQSNGSVYCRYEVDNTGSSQVKLTTHEETATAVMLHWEDITDSDFGYYQVEKLVDGSYETVGKTSTDLGYLVEGCKPETEYTFRVVAYDDLGNRGEASEELTVSTTSDGISPTIRAVYPVASNYSSSLQLQLQAEDNDALDHGVFSYSLDGENYTLLAEVPGEQKRQVTYRYDMDISGFDEGSVFIKFEVYDVSGNKNGLLSDGTEVIVEYIIDHTPPKRPQNLASTDANGCVTLTWDQAEENDVSAYRIYRADYDRGIFELIQDNWQSINYYDTNVEIGKSYLYKIAAVDLAGNVSNETEEIAVTVLHDEERPQITGVTPDRGSVIGANPVIKAWAVDNAGLGRVTIEYARGEEKQWQTIYDEEATGRSYLAVTEWDTSDLPEGLYHVRVCATDYAGNRSELYQAAYMIDHTPPKQPTLTAETGHFEVNLTVSMEDESDVDHCILYRREQGKTVYEKVAELTESSHTDAGITPNVKYEYKVEAYDENGNYSTSEVVTGYGDDIDVVAPTAIAPENIVGVIGKQIVLDGMGSGDNVGITRFEWNMGNGVKLYGGRHFYTYQEAGIYQVSLTVWDAAGNKSTTNICINIYDMTGKGAATVTVRDMQGQPLPYAYVYLRTGEEESLSLQADGNGEIIIRQDVGLCEVAAYAPGYLPGDMEITIDEFEEASYDLMLQKEELVVGELSVHRMELHELIEAGVDMSDPDNYNTYVFKVTLQFAEQPLPVTIEYYCSTESKHNEGQVQESYESSERKTYYWGGAPMKIGGGKLEERPIMVIETVQAISWLKEMYSVDLNIINAADPKYVIEDASATLNLPESGISLAKTASGQSLVQELEDIHGGESRTVSWIVRGDEPGSYTISADFNGILTPFETPVNAHFESENEFTVNAGKGIRITIMPEATAFYGETYYIQFKVENTSDLPLYNFATTFPEYKEPVGTTIIIDTQTGEETVSGGGETLHINNVEKLKQQVVLKDGQTLVFDVLKPGDSYFGTYSRTVTDENEDGMYWVLVNELVETLKGANLGVDVELDPIGGHISPMIMVYEDLAPYMTLLYPLLVADPVNVSSGAFVDQMEALSVTGVTELPMNLSYSSTDSDCTGQMGFGWHHDYEAHLTDKNGSITFYMSPGRTAIFLNQRALDSKLYGMLEDGEIILEDTEVSLEGTYICPNADMEGYVLTRHADGTYHMDMPNGCSYDFDANGQLTKIGDSEGNVINLSHEGNITTIQEQATGKSLHYETDEDGHMVRIYDDNGRQVLLQYTGGCLTSVTNPVGETMVFTYDENHRLLTETSPGGICYVDNIYDEEGRVVSQSNANGKITTFAYETGEDGLNRTTVTDPEGNQYYYVSNKDGQILKASDENGAQNTYQYTESGELAVQTDSYGHSVTRRYDGDGNLVRVTDAAGKVSNMQYDPDGNVIVLSNAYGETARYTYDKNHHMLSMTDPLGTKTSYTYDKQGQLSSMTTEGLGTSYYSYTDGRMTSSTDANGNTTTYVYDGVGNQIQTKDALGNVTTMEYNSLRQLVKKTDEAGGVTTYSYDCMGNPVVVTDALGHETRYTYDAAGNLIRTTYADGSYETCEYDGAGNVIRETLNGDTVITHTYDKAGNLLLTTYPDGTSIKKEYDLLNQVVAETDSSGRTTRYEYYPNGNLYKTTFADNTWVMYTYDNSWRVIAETAQDGSSRTYKYDAMDHVVSTTDPLGNTQKYEYDANGRLIKETDANGNSTSYGYDANGNCIEKVNALGVRCTMTYDALNRMTSATVHTSEGEYSVSYEYDSLGRVVSSTDEEGNTSHMEYDRMGNLLRVIDPKGNVTEVNRYDELNRVTHTEDALGYAEDYSYDGLGNLIAVVESLNAEAAAKNADSSKTTSYTYDIMGRITGATDPEEGKTAQTYDEAGNVSSITDANGGTSSYTYDIMGRVLTATSAIGSKTSYTYNAEGLLQELKDANAETTSYTYDMAGRVTSMTDDLGTVSYTYDKNGNVLTVTDAGGSLGYTYDVLNRVTCYTDYNGRTIKYSYDELGNLIALTYPGGEIVRYTYYKNGYVHTVTDTEGQVTEYTYDPCGNLTQTALPNGIRELYYYDKAGQLVLHEEERDGAILSSRSYSYDGWGNLTEIASEETDRENDGAGIDILSDAIMEYDGDNRLISYNGQEVIYDAVGNMTYGPLDGKMQQLTYDCRNRLVSAGGITYTYDPANNRIGMESEDYREEYVVDSVSSSLSRVLVTYTYPKDGSSDADSQNTGQAENQQPTKTLYVYGQGLISHTADHRTTYYHYNNLGSTTRLTDEVGNTLERYTYGPYGELLSGDTSLTRFLYNGRCGVTTDDNGLYYMRQRYYNPQIKRFINQDILTGNMGSSQSMNRYCYVQGNPISYTDPFGLCPILDEQDWLMIHGVLAIAECYPPTSMVANLIDCIIYAVVDHDYFSALLCGLGFLSCGMSSVISNLISAEGKTASIIKSVAGVIHFGADVAVAGLSMGHAYKAIQQKKESGEEVTLMDWLPVILSGIGLIGWTYRLIGASKSLAQETNAFQRAQPTLSDSTVVKGGQQLWGESGLSAAGDIVESGRYSVGDATFMDANDAFVSNISRRTDVDANGYFDVIAHGTPNGIQITHNGKHMIVDHRTAARLIQNSAGYNGQAIRLLSCNTGALDNGFAQNLANKLNVEVYAPTNYLWSTPNGNYFVAGMNNSRLPDMNDVGTFKLFSPGGN